MAKIEVIEQHQKGMYTPSQTLVGDTYKSIQVRDYTLGEMLNLSRINENETIADFDVETLRHYLNRIIKMPEGYTIEDAYLCDVKFALLYAMALTDSSYRYPNLIKCRNKECKKEFVHQVPASSISVDTSGILAEVEIEGYKIKPVRVGDYLANLTAVQEIIKENKELEPKLNKTDEDDTEEIPATYSLMSMVASFLHIEGKSFNDKMQLIEDEVPASVAFTIQDEGYLEKLDITVAPLKCKCPHCEAEMEYTPTFELRGLLPSV